MTTGMTGYGQKDSESSRPYDIEVLDDSEAAHLLQSPPQWPEDAPGRTKIVIVGAGLAGLSAAWVLRDKDFELYDISALPGGSSCGGKYDQLSFSLGAHYELDFPEYYGQEVLGMLRELRLIEFQPARKMWSFVDRKYYVSPDREERALIQGRFYDSALPRALKGGDVIDLVVPYTGEMPLPTRLIKEKHRALDQITFQKFLAERGVQTDSVLARCISYQLTDDYGAGFQTVSALAGIHYHACRPYYQQEVKTFSPPQGNFYFVEKFLEQIPSAKIHLSHLVTRIRKVKKGLEVEVLNIQKKTRKKVIAENVVYAGQKHALKFVYPDDATLFRNNQYAPWCVINFILHRKSFPEAFWQNEHILNQHDFLGFVNSRSQAGTSDEYSALTAYFCLPPEKRAQLLSIRKNPAPWVRKTLQLIQEFLKEDISAFVQKVFVKPYGHGMPVPIPGYLFADANENRSHPGLVYAGVDNHRLPLFYEAVDSGLQAARTLESAWRKH